MVKKTIQDNLKKCHDEGIEGNERIEGSEGKGRQIVQYCRFWYKNPALLKEIGAFQSSPPPHGDMMNPSVRRDHWPYSANPLPTMITIMAVGALLVLVAMAIENFPFLLQIVRSTVC